jgi:hypothetical protein
MALGHWHQDNATICKLRPHALRKLAPFQFYFLGGGPDGVSLEPPSLGASLGLHACGRPSGAKQLPLTVPCGDMKLQSCPLFKALQASSASGGGPRCCCGGCWAYSRLDESASAQNRLVRAMEWFARCRMSRLLKFGGTCPPMFTLWAANVEKEWRCLQRYLYAVADIDARRKICSLWPTNGL